MTKARVEPRSVALEVDVFTTKPTRRCSNEERFSELPYSHEHLATEAVHRVKVKKGIYLSTQYWQTRQMSALILYRRMPSKAVPGESMTK